MERARVVVIGGGITGASVAYHLAKGGWTDVALVEKGQLTSGSTCHAAGLVTQFNPSPTMMRFRRYSIELFEELGVFEPVGSLRIASSEAQLRELERGISRARGIGLEVELLSPEETLRLLPAATGEALHGAVWVPGDGYLDPHTATYALADAARSLGASVLTATRVIGIELSPRRGVKAVLTDRGPIETEVVVNACGIWAPQVAAMAGLWAPSTPVDHQHVLLKAVPGHELPRDMPCFRDPDNLVYGKAESGGMGFGGYEPNPKARRLDGVPWEHGERSLPPDLPLRAAPPGRGEALPVPRRSRDREARLPPRCADSRRAASPGPDARRARLLDGRRTFAQRLRGRRRNRASPGRVDHDGGDRARPLAVPPVAVWQHLPRPRLCGGDGTRGLQVLLPPALPVRHRRVGAPAAHEPAPRPAAGARMRLRHEERLGASRLPRAGEALASRRR